MDFPPGTFKASFFLPAQPVSGRLLPVAFSCLRQMLALWAHLHQKDRGGPAGHLSPRLDRGQSPGRREQEPPPPSSASAGDGLERSRSRGFGQSERASAARLGPGRERQAPEGARREGAEEEKGRPVSALPPPRLLALRPRGPPVPLAQTSNPTTIPALRIQQLRFRSGFRPLSIPML